MTRIPSVHGKVGVVAAVIAVTAGAMGFFAGATPDVGPPPLRPVLSTALADGSPMPMPGYRDLRQQRRGLNGAMYTTAFERLAPSVAEARAGGEDPLTSAIDRTRALQERARRRAYDGAPPTIPHPIGQIGMPPCLTCHETGLAIGDKVAPRMSHATYPSCVQCHAPESEGKPPNAERAPLHPNSFVGLAASGGGTRAWAGAPPTIPHPTLMRSECSSCHGPGGLFGLKTPHPDRRSCVQCHAVSAELDQKAGR